MKYLLNRRTLLFLLIDICIVNFTFIVAFYVVSKTLLVYSSYSFIAAVYTFFYIVCFHFFGVYRSLWTHAGVDEFVMLAVGCVTGGALSLGFNSLSGLGIPSITIILCALFNLLFVGGFRCSFRVYRTLFRKAEAFDKKLARRVLVIGAGSAGAMVINEMREHPELRYLPIGLIDDDKNKIGSNVSGIRVLGNRNRIKTIVTEKSIDEIIIAIPSLVGRSLTDLVGICSETGCRTRILPGIYELIDGKKTLNQIRDVDAEDLLGRESISLNNEGISNYISGKTVMVTGGGGSIGSELCRQIVSYDPKELLMLDCYENSAYDLFNELKLHRVQVPITVIIASVTDRKAMEDVFLEYRPEVVFHAAAHKHVPLMETNPAEAVKNNVFGTINVVECADMAGTQKFVMISTDKAVNPTNIMGATKRICEMVIQTMSRQSNTEFVAVRFGNVLGSNGSVVPLFKKQIAGGGPVTVTDRNVTRYFMTIREATQLVLQAVTYAQGGEIFVLDMGRPVKIYDLACELIKLSGLELGRDIEIQITGLRPGEKLYEELLMAEEGLEKTQHEKIFIGKPIPVDAEMFHKSLLELRVIADGSDKEKLLKKVEEIVPTYKRICNDCIRAGQCNGCITAE